MDSVVAANERISRFARHASEYSVVVNRIYHTMFMPPATMRLSVFRTSDWPDSDLWEAADAIVGQGRFRPRARGDLNSERIRDVELAIVPEPAPHPRHADIIGWSEEKSERIDAAKSLAVQAKLVLRQDP